jgi:hypothetical protein
MAEENTPQQKDTGLSVIFNAVVRETLQDFPALNGRFILVDIEEGALYGLPNLLATRFPSVEAVEAYLNEGAQAASAANTSVSRFDPAHDLRVIFYNSAAKQQTFGGNDAENILGIIDHEIGHLVADNETEDTPDGAIRSETRADLFAALRNAQRSGSTAKQNGAADAESIRLLAFTRAYALMADGGAEAQEHFTAFALLELAETSNTTHLAALKPQMAAGMAEFMGQQYAAKASEAAEIAAAFKPYRDAIAAGGTPEQALKTVAETALGKNASDGTAKLGGFLLDYYLKGKISIHGQPVQLAGDYWDGVREQLKAREAPAAPAGLIILPKHAGLKP